MARSYQRITDATIPNTLSALFSELVAEMIEYEVPDAPESSKRELLAECSVIARDAAVEITNKVYAVHCHVEAAHTHETVDTTQQKSISQYL